MNSTKHFVIPNILRDAIFNQLNQLVRINVKLTKQLKEGLFIGMSINKIWIKKSIENSYRKCFLPRVNINNYNLLIDSRNFYDQPINDQIKKYNEIRKIATRQGNDYTTGCLL